MVSVWSPALDLLGQVDGRMVVLSFMERTKERIKKYTLGPSHTAASPAIKTRMRKSLAVCRCRLLTVLCLLFW
jgi:hypothetical protein